MTCPGCGTENEPGGRFCEACGTPLASTCPSCGEASSRTRGSARLRLLPSRRRRPRPGTVGHGNTPNARPSPSVASSPSCSRTSSASPPSPRTATRSRPRAPLPLLRRRPRGDRAATAGRSRSSSATRSWPSGAPRSRTRTTPSARSAPPSSWSTRQGPPPQAPGPGRRAHRRGGRHPGRHEPGDGRRRPRQHRRPPPGRGGAGHGPGGRDDPRAAERAIVFEPVGEHSLKGKVTPVPAWRRSASWRSAAAARADRRARAAVRRPRRGAPAAQGRAPRPRPREARRLMSITGPGGIGKSRLVWELEKYIDGVSEDIWWHRGRSPSYGEGITFWALGEMVRRRARLTEDDDEATTRERIAATLEEYVPDASERERIGRRSSRCSGSRRLGRVAATRSSPPGACSSSGSRSGDHGARLRGPPVGRYGPLDFIDHLLDWSRRGRSSSSPWPAPSCSTAARLGRRPPPPDRPRPGAR
jgi:hypothetical protein